MRDMHHFFIVGCCVLYALLMQTSGYYIPHVSRKSSHISELRSWYRVGHGHGSSVRKRSGSRFLLFSHLLTRHGQNSRYSDEHEFVERMFSLFDFNDDLVIERDEFRTILQLLGVISL